MPPADDLTQPFVAGPPVEDELELSLAAAQGPPILRGLRIWFVLIGALGLLGILAGQAEMALSMAMAGAFVAAHAADRDPFYRPLHLLLTGVIVAGGAAVFAALAIWLATQSLPGEMRPVTVGIAGGGAVLCVLTAIRPLADGLASAVFRTLRPNHVLRLGARIVFMLVLFVIPGWSVFPDLIDTLASRQEPLLDTKQLIGSAVGLSMLALGGVGYLVRRDARQAFERLGLRMPKPAHYVVVVLGVVGLYLLNVGMEAFQRQVFPDLWEHDQRVNQMLVGGLGIGGGLLLGVCAGLGEELSMRGALQPRLGLIATAFLFSILHVQYSWVGILTIFILGITLGVIRDRTSTTVAILVHAIYDMLAAFTAGVSGNP
ncbi:MAG TPA: CPBP family intramembrane glutamic endopeptidase [Candidatus Eisenbacteria bacterium]|nr:CPBP family intramembrane glutamic endopeptidase [Candidatus Eisenbacteria bacterium]